MIAGTMELSEYWYLTMGNSLSGEAVRDSDDAPQIAKFYSDQAWIEGRAEDQLINVSNLPGIRHVAAFPDLHPGKYGPVGCAVLSERLYPQLIGNDIGCGMSLFQLDLLARKVRADKAAERLRVLEEFDDDDNPEHLEAAGLPPDLFVSALGTIGGGNHFCELQTVHEVCEAGPVAEANLDPSCAVLLVHSGSRGLGTRVFDSVVEAFKNGLDPKSVAGQAYLKAQLEAVKWASLNRAVIAQRAAKALRADLRLLTDAPHNQLSAHDGLWLHRKGAAKADLPIVPLAGTRDALSFLMQPAQNNPDALSSMAHGAGRKHDRGSMHGRVGKKKSELARLEYTSFKGRVICEDRDLLIEEAPKAYKNPARVRDEVERSGIAKCVASLRPIVTFKKARREDWS